LKLRFTKPLIVGGILLAIVGGGTYAFAATSTTAMKAGDVLNVSCPNGISNSNVAANAETITCSSSPIGPKAIPVLVYHFLNVGCKASAGNCGVNEPEGVSSTQLKNQLSYMQGQGYTTITLTQYDNWLQGNTVGLPPKPFLITVDNGAQNFGPTGAAILQSYGDTAVSFLDTGYADGASNVCVGTPDAADPSVNTQGVSPTSGCPYDDLGWHSTWTQLQAIQQQYPGVYQWALEAGPSGHFVMNYTSQSATTAVDPACTWFFACEIGPQANSATPAQESDAQYEARVQADLTTGMAEITKYLGTAHTDFGGWVVPYSVLGYPTPGCDTCTPQDYNGPVNSDGNAWLVDYAQANFHSVFVEDSIRNGIANERYRWDEGGSTTLNQFEKGITNQLAAGYFNK
jgi:hypothetical protein